MMLILEALPFDLSDPAEIAQTSLICANLPKVVQALDQIDPWIACHLTDLLDKVGIIDQPEEYVYVLLSCELFLISLLY